MTATNEPQYMKIPISSWTELTSELRTQESELIALQNRLATLKKPSQKLLDELSEAKNLLAKSQTELASAKDELTALFKDREELQTSLQRLRESINKERGIQNRRLWQNRIWCLIGGVAVGYAVHK
jgi:chromosome segregation ATPase